ncbi:MAG: cytochrome P460 family protein [Caulobacteraceae bacterium]
MKVIVRIVASFAMASVVLALPQAARSEQGVDSREIARPADVEAWPTVGTTLRLDRTDHATPWQMRQVFMAPGDYARFLETREFSDGTTFAVLFYPVARDDSHSPPLYYAQREQAFVMEVIDRGHPDGRRFYTFTPGAERAVPLPAGNECAVCHNARGSFGGTFARMYPALARHLEEPVTQ